MVVEPLGAERRRRPPRAVASGVSRRWSSTGSVGEGKNRATTRRRGSPGLRNSVPPAGWPASTATISASTNSSTRRGRLACRRRHHRAINTVRRRSLASPTQSPTPDPQRPVSLAAGRSPRRTARGADSSQARAMRSPAPRSDDVAELQRFGEALHHLYVVAGVQGAGRGHRRVYAGAWRHRPSGVEAVVTHERTHHLVVPRQVLLRQRRHDTARIGHDRHDLRILSDREALPTQSFSTNPASDVETITFMRNRR